jgi:hypothetical protein
MEVEIHAARSDRGMNLSGTQNHIDCSTASQRCSKPSPTRRWTAKYGDRFVSKRNAPPRLRREEIVKRDMNLALAILKTLEGNKSPQLSEFDMESALKNTFDVSNRGVWYQLNLLADATLVRSMGTDWRLTWNGHEFLKAAEDT